MTHSRNPSKVVGGAGYRWRGVSLTDYKDKGEGTLFKDITRQTLLGEGEGEERLRFLTRYFEIAPGGYSTLERHEHPHAVVVIRGGGRVVLEDGVHEVSVPDCVYIAPYTFHQFHATGAEPLGFLCMVDRERDRPELPGEDDLRRLLAHPEVGPLIRY